MSDHSTLEKLKADRQTCLCRLRRDSMIAGCFTFLAALVHLFFHTSLLVTVLLVVMMWLYAAAFGLAYLMLGAHIERM